MTTPFKRLAVLCLVGWMLWLPAFSEDMPPPSHELPEGFCYVHEVIGDVVLDIRYAGEHNFVGSPIDGYEAPYAIMTVEGAQALKEAADVFRGMGYRLKIFDAYRPQSAVKHFVRWSADEDDMKMQAVFYPGYKTKSRIVDEGYIARNSSHMRGSAVDLTLTDMAGNELDMGTCFDFFGKASWHGAKGLTQEQEANRNLLKTVMEKCGFKPFEKEWWHYRLKNEPFKTEKFDFPVK